MFVILSTSCIFYLKYIYSAFSIYRGQFSLQISRKIPHSSPVKACRSWLQSLIKVLPLSPAQRASSAELWCFHWSALRTKGWVNNREAGGWRRHRTHYEVIVMLTLIPHNEWPQNENPVKFIRCAWNNLNFPGNSHGMNPMVWIHKQMSAICLTNEMQWHKYSKASTLHKCRRYIQMLIYRFWR